MIETHAAYEAYKRLLYPGEDFPAPFELLETGSRHIVIKQRVYPLDEQMVKDVEMVTEFFEQNNTRVEIKQYDPKQ